MAENLTPREHGDLVTGVMGGIERIERAHSRRRRGFAVVSATTAVAVVVSISVAVWLAPRPQQATPPTPTTSATPTPTLTPDPIVTPDPVATPPVAASPADWVLSPDGLGPVKLGMPLDQAAAEVGDAQLACPAVYTGDDHALWITGANGEPTDAVQVVAWARANATAGPRTAEGIGIGSTIDDVRAAYPDSVEVNRQGLHIQVGRMFFRVESGTVDTVGATTRDIPYEYCG